jgi:hypothetical protein
MEPIFSLPYSEFCVAQQLARLLPAAEGYSLYAPVSRQQKGVDLLIARRLLPSRSGEIPLCLRNSGLIGELLLSFV